MTMSKKTKAPNPINDIFMDPVEQENTTCEVCGAEFLETEDLKVHLEQMHLNGSLKNRYCPFCLLIFPSIEDLAQHIKVCHFPLIKCCEYCLRAFTSQEDRLRHEAKHVITGRGLYSCYECRVIFQNLYKLKEHEINCHTDPTDGYIILNCLQHLSGTLNLKASSYLASKIKKNYLICVSCNLKTRIVDKYISHLEEQSCKSYVCDLCTDVFGKKSDLIRHLSEDCKLKSVSGICSKCGQYYKTSLKKHRKVCMPMKCIPCDVIFSNVSDFMSHQSQHGATIKLVSCSICRNEYASEEKLNKHYQNVHERNSHLFKYECPYCDAKFKHPKNLLAHFASTHKELEPFTCKICDQKFKFRKRFTFHIKLVHNSVGVVQFDNMYNVSFSEKQPLKTVENIENTHTDNIGNNNSENFNKTCLDTKNEDLVNSKITNLDGKSETFKNDMEITEKFVDKTIINMYNGNKTESPPMKTSKSRNVQIHSDFLVTSETEGNETEIDVEKKRTMVKEKNLVKFSVLTSATEGNETENHSQERKFKRKRKFKSVKKRRRAEPSFTDSDEEPLLIIKRRNQREKRHKKFICKTCNKNCYTFLNYQHHLSLHSKSDMKKCIKCVEIFSSEEELNKHITERHSTSKLTETLKRIIERKKEGHKNEIDINKVKIRFANTLKKVNISNSHDVATISETNALCVRNFIENFTPELNENVANVKIDTNITIKMTKESSHKPIIHMVPFKEEKVTNLVPKLRMPVEFKSNCAIKPVVEIKFVDNIASKRTLNFGDSNDNKEDNVDQHNIYDDTDMDKNDYIPDVGEEIMLEDAPEPKATEKRQILIPNLPKEYDNIRIATLQAEAPFYKIVKMKDLLKAQQESSVVEERKSTGKIILPNGKTLVNVNPLAHLLGDKADMILQQPKKRKYYQPKVIDFESVIAKEITRLEAKSDFDTLSNRKRVANRKDKKVSR